MSYEDIEKERANRAAKDAAGASKKRGRKRKGTVPPVEAKAKKARRSEVEAAEDNIAVGRDGELLLCSPTRRWIALIRQEGWRFLYDPLLYSRRLASVAFSAKRKQEV